MVSAAHNTTHRDPPSQAPQTRNMRMRTSKGMMLIKR